MDNYSTIVTASPVVVEAKPEIKILVFHLKKEYLVGFLCSCLNSSIDRSLREDAAVGGAVGAGGSLR